MGIGMNHPLAIFEQPVIAPLERVVLPTNLDGHAGDNRNRVSRSQIDALNDVDAIRAWLDRYTDSPATFESYRKEAERLLLWATRQLGKPVSSLSHEDLLAYQRFLANPTPEAQWILASKRKLPRSHRDWRPFAGPLAKTSQRQAIVIINAMFSWLVSAGYLAGNPLSLSRQRSRSAKPQIARFLPSAVWTEVKTTVEAMSRESTREQEHYARSRWMLSLLFLGGLRISEVVNNTMGAFYARRDRHGVERWWINIIGKGNKERQVPATDELLIELTRYRQAINLTPLPSGIESLPLVLPIGGKVRPMTRVALHGIVKGIFAQTAVRLQNRGPEFEGAVALLEKASAHWLRHTAGSSMADGELDIRFLRDNLGHSSIATTSIYLHSEDDERHRQTQRALRIAW
jgi:integrase/recombinase XerD